MTGKYTRQDSIDSVYCVTELGKGLKLVKDRKVEFNHPLAYKMLEGYEEFVGDRPLKQNHVDTLVNAMMRGTLAIVKDWWSSDGPTSLHDSGVETGAPGLGRTEYGETSRRPCPFWPKSMYTRPRRAFITRSTVAI